MRDQLSYGLVYAVVAVVGLTAPSRTLGCTCPPRSVEERCAYAEIIVQGVVAESEAPGPRQVMIDGRTATVISGGDMVRYRVIVAKVWKGTAADTVFVYSPRDGAACGLQFGMGKEYLIYCRLHPGPKEDEQETHWRWADARKFPVMTTGLCSGTARLADAAEDLEYLGKQPARARTPNDQ